jgi:hypothetical protein
LVFHLLAIACWCVPIDSPLIPLCRNLVRPYFLWAGLFLVLGYVCPVSSQACLRRLGNRPNARSVPQ